MSVIAGTPQLGAHEGGSRGVSGSRSGRNRLHSEGMAVSPTSRPLYLKYRPSGTRSPCRPFPACCWRSPTGRWRRGTRLPGRGGRIAGGALPPRSRHRAAAAALAGLEGGAGGVVVVVVVVVAGRPGQPADRRDFTVL